MGQVPLASMRPQESDDHQDNEQDRAGGNIGGGGNLESHNNSIEIGRNQSARSSERRRRQSS